MPAERDSGRQRWMEAGAPYLMAIGVALASTLVNAQSQAADLSREGVTALWRPYALELTSFAGLAIAFVPAAILDAALARVRAPLAARVGAYIAFSVVFCGLHLLSMVGARVLLFQMDGQADYRFGPFAPRALYEYRKDLLALAMFAGGAWLWRRAFVTPDTPETQPSPREAAFLAPYRGGEVLVRAADIDWVEAQGNYVALHVNRQTYLIRETLKGAEERLSAAPFIRTHRSALVNAQRVRGLGRSEDGEWRVELTNGEIAPFSERRRGDVLRALSGSAARLS